MSARPIREPQRAKRSAKSGIASPMASWCARVSAAKSTFRAEPLALDEHVGGDKVVVDQMTLLGTALQEIALPVRQSQSSRLRGVPFGTACRRASRE